MTTALVRLALIGSGSVATAALWVLLRRTPLARSRTWQRSNYRGVSVSLLGGPVAVVATVAGCAGIAAASGANRRTAVALVVVVAVAGAAGIYDDLCGDVAAKGLAGHLRAAARRELTSGVVKISALGASGLAVAILLAGGWSLRTLVDGLLIAGTANLANLFDLRPGRAAKITAVGLVIVVAARAGAVTPLAWCAGVAIAILRYDVREHLMLGDGGANSLGAALGVGIVVAASESTRLGVLAGVIALTLLSEVVSFSRVIEASPPLRWLDGLGRIDGGQQARS